MAIIILSNWYQLDFAIQEHPLKDLLRVALVMDELKMNRLISKWFFLFEVNQIKKIGTIRIRMCAKDKDDLQKSLNILIKEYKLQMDDGLPFSDYQESEESLVNSDVVETFANVMSEVTALLIKKLHKKTSFENYRVIERLQHCIFNAFIPLQFKSEEYFLQQRIFERLKQPFDKEFDF